MKKAFFMLSLTVLFLATSAQATVVEFEGRYWMPDLDANAKVEENGVGTDIDVKSDLGFGDENFPEGRFIWQANKKNKFQFSYLRFEYDGDKTITRQIEYNGRTYTAGSRVVSNLDVQYLRLGWNRQLLTFADDKLKFGFMLDVKGIIADMSLNASALGFNESEKFAGGLPTVGLSLGANPHQKFNLFAEISGIPAGSYGHFFDAEGGIKFIPFKNLSLMAGYRVVDLKVEYDDNSADLQLTGPFFGGALRF